MSQIGRAKVFGPLMCTDLRFRHPLVTNLSTMPLTTISMFAASCSGVNDAKPTRMAVVGDGDRCICVLDRARLISCANAVGEATALGDSAEALDPDFERRLPVVGSLGLGGSKFTGIGRLGPL